MHDHTNPDRTIQDHKRLYRTIRDYTGLCMIGISFKTIGTIDKITIESFTRQNGVIQDTT